MDSSIVLIAAGEIKTFHVYLSGFKRLHEDKDVEMSPKCLLSDIIV